MSCLRRSLWPSPAPRPSGSAEPDPEKRKYPGGAFDPLGLSKDAKVGCRSKHFFTSFDPATLSSSPHFLLGATISAVQGDVLVTLLPTHMHLLAKQA